MFRLYLILPFFLLLAACAPPPPATPPPLALRPLDFWQQASGELRSGELQPWQFVAQAGDQIRVRVVNALDLTLTLTTLDGTPVTQGTNQIDATLPVGGLYIVTVSTTADVQYDIGLSYTDRPNPADATPKPLPVVVSVPTPTPPYYAALGSVISPIRSGETLTGEMTRRDERHVYTFEGETDTYIGLEVRRTSGAIDPVLALYAPSGTALAIDDNSGSARAARLRNIHLTESGTYSLLVTGHALTGSYEISLLSASRPVAITPVAIIPPTVTPIVETPFPTVGPAVSGQTLIDHVPVVGNIETPGDFDRYPFQAGTGDVLTISVRAAENSSILPKGELYDPLGALIATTDADGLIGGQRAAETGTYILLITAESNTTGAYSAAYGTGFSYQEVRRGLTIADQTYSGEVARKGLRDVWALDLNAGDVISAAAGVLDLRLDPVLELVAPDGSLVAMDDNSGGNLDALIASARAPISGRYLLRVTGANVLSSGGYTLIWRYINLAPTASPPPGTVLLMSMDDTVQNGAYQFYPFQGQAGMQISIKVIAPPNSSLDAVAALLSTNGTVIAEGDDSDGDLNPRFTATLPADGTYTVRVNGYLTSGDFTLTIEQVFTSP